MIGEDSLNSYRLLEVKHQIVGLIHWDWEATMKPQNPAFQGSSAGSQQTSEGRTPSRRRVPKRLEPEWRTSTHHSAKFYTSRESTNS